jgi:tRNA-2-methylthio-N6-dimethylallyladenosine synthase
LCEGPSKKNAAVYSGYSEENKLVNFTGTEGLEDRIVDVEITETHSFSLDGKAV